MPQVMIFMGSGSDWQTMQEAAQVLSQLEISFSAHVASAHRTPERVRQLVKEGEAQGVQVFICGAGMAAHLAGFVAAHTLKPVLGVPLPGGVAEGLDALLSTVQMPAGVPVACLAVGKAGARNAAYLAAQILALKDEALSQRLQGERQKAAAKVLQAESQLQAEGPST
jgi:phosphoribosylaminoimidazole carboxylase PurE protein